MSEPKQPEQIEAGKDIETQPPGLTRRQWILRLGEAAVLAGFSGSASEELAAAYEPQSPGTAAVLTELPPGLYDPSGEHMAHVLLRDDRFVTPPAGSETEYAAAHPGTFEPVFFSEGDFKIARRLVGLMLNSGTDTTPGLAAVSDETLDEIAQWIDLALSQAAGAREAAKNLSSQHHELAVHYYGEEAVRRLETAEPEKTWKDGLLWLDQKSRESSSQGFMGLAEAQQLSVLTSIGKSAEGAESQAREEGKESAGSRFYKLLKAETIRGYYTSRSGLKELDYQGNAFHAESPGCPTGESSPHRS